MIYRAPKSEWTESGRNLFLFQVNYGI